MSEGDHRRFCTAGPSLADPVTVTGVESETTGFLAIRPVEVVAGSWGRTREGTSTAGTALLAETVQIPSVLKSI